MPRNLTFNNPTVKTTVNHDLTIETDIRGVADKVWRSVVNTQDDQVRLCLIKLGWTPPVNPHLSHIPTNFETLMSLHRACVDDLRSVIHSGENAEYLAAHTELVQRVKVKWGI